MSIKMILFSLPISFSRIFLSKIICIDFLSILSFFSFKNQISLAFLSMILFSLSISFLKIFLSKVIFINVFVNNILFSFKDLIILDVFVNIVQSAKVEEHFKSWRILMFFKFWPNIYYYITKMNQSIDWLVLGDPKLASSVVYTATPPPRSRLFLLIIYGIIFILQFISFL